MKLRIFILILLAMATTVQIQAQGEGQTVRGSIIDQDNRLPLMGAEVIILGSDPLKGAVSDARGQYRLENVPVGRISLAVRYLGFEDKSVHNVLVNSGKEVILDIELEEAAIGLSEVTVKATENKGEALNEMSLLSARSISAEETSRYAGGFNDPSRIVSNFAGVSTTGDGGNDIIIRGNSPKYIQWRMEGMEIGNPNHFADQSAVGGAVSVLNNNLLASSDFLTAAFEPEYGNALSGVYDLKMRSGNNEKREMVFGFGLLGTDLTVEGPFSKNYRGSYLVNYRYSTASIIEKLGLMGDISGIPKFQDAAFKITLPTKNAGNFSLFGLAGLSSFLFEDVTPAVWETPGDGFMQSNIIEDFEKKSHLINIGLNHNISINKKSYIKSSLAFSHEGATDKIFENQVINIFDEEGVFDRDSTIAERLNYEGEYTKSNAQFSFSYHYKFNSKNKIKIGIRNQYLQMQNKQSNLLQSDSSRYVLLDFDEGIGNNRAFISWKHRINSNLSFVGGIHTSLVSLNKKFTIEPRLAMNWSINETNSLYAGYGKHSTMESLHNYFAITEDAEGNAIEANKDLDLLKAHHFVLGYEKRIGKNFRLKAEAYYQHLYDIPVEEDQESYYSTINEGLEFQYLNLNNEGTGKNYGFELTFERFFSKGYYYLANASIFESKYKGSDGIERNTRYNGNYLVNFLFGKEFEKLGKKDNGTFTVNGKIFAGGGKKMIPLLRDAAGNLAVDQEAGEFWDYTKAYENDIGDNYQIILSASYKWNKPKATHELFLNLDNITNNTAKLSEFYDEREENSIGYVKQFGFFPNLMYRAYF